MFQCGFSLFETEGEKILARQIVLPKTSLLAVGLIKQIEFMYASGTSKERDEWEESGYTFTETLDVDQNKHFSLNMNDKIWDEVTHCELCISLSEEDRGCMFINAPSKIAYYNVSMFEECGEDVKKLVSHLLLDGFIYRKKMHYNA